MINKYKALNSKITAMFDMSISLKPSIESTVKRMYRLQKQTSHSTIIPGVKKKSTIKTEKKTIKKKRKTKLKLMLNILRLKQLQNNAQLHKSFVQRKNEKSQKSNRRDLTSRLIENKHEEFNKTANDAVINNKVNILTLKPSFAIKKKRNISNADQQTKDSKPNFNQKLKFPMIKSQNNLLEKEQF